VVRRFSGRRLREARIAAGKKPEQLAAEVSRTVFSIYEYERGRVLPSVPVLAQIADVLDVSVDALFERVPADAA
jgi:transcriptional regulator with XRE-family HTH domain